MSADEPRAAAAADSVADPTTATSGALEPQAADGQDLLNPVLAGASLPVVRANPLDPDPLPVPESPPVDAYAAHDVVEIGEIAIPEIGLTHPVVEGVTLTSINVGPGHWPGSALPGRRGNAVFPGHRTTYSHPFYDLDLLEAGDRIEFSTPDGTHTYAVSETLIVDPSELWVVSQTDEPTVTLIACHPKGSAAQRIVVKGELVESVPSLGAIAAASRIAEVGARAPI